MRLVAIAAVLAFGLTLPAWAGLNNHRMSFAGAERSFLVYTPRTSAVPSDGRPLVIVLHGGGGSARQIMRSTRRGFHDFADRTGALIVYPEAIGRVWDLEEGRISQGLSPRRDDPGFLRAMVGSIDRRYGLDRTRVFATGISRGGQASFALACKWPGGIRAIASVAMPLPAVFNDDCARELPVMVINGTDDPIVPYGGGPIRIGQQERDIVLSTNTTMEKFRLRNGCGPTPAVTSVGRVDRLNWRGCRAPTVLLRVNGGGHTWPGQRSVLPARIVGATNRDIDATREIVAFFDRF